MPGHPTPHTQTYEPVNSGNGLPLHALAVLRILIILAIGVGYASTMNIGMEYYEWGNHWGYDPSWYGIQLLFIFSGFLAARSMAQGRTIIAFFKSRFRSLWPALIAATLVVVCFIYPLMSTPDPAVRMSASDLAAYFFKTVFLIDLGARMPGLLDDAEYMCLLQGAIWTVRIGVILHVGFLLGWVTRMLRNRNIVLILSVFAIAIYVKLVDTAVANPEFGERIKPVLPIFRLGYAYLAGVALFMWQEKLQQAKQKMILLPILIALVTTAIYKWLPWSSIHEVLGVAVWTTVSLAFLQHAPLFLRHCPRLSPVLYVSIWPAAQIIVAFSPSASQMGIIQMSAGLASIAAVLLFLGLCQARIQPARL